MVVDEIEELYEIAGSLKWLCRAGGCCGGEYLCGLLGRRVKKIAESFEAKETAIRRKKRGVKPSD